MSKRVNIVLPDRTLKVLDRVAGKGRSRYINEAILFYVQTQVFSDLRRRLDQGFFDGKLRINPPEEFPLEEQETPSRNRKERAAQT